MSNFYSGTIQKGSQGDDVKAWQEFLRSKNFNVAVDGIFGDETETATKSFQGMYGIGADGIVGERTWGIAGFSNMNNAVSAPKTNPLPTNPTYDTTSWDDTTKGQETSNAYNDAKDAVNGYGDYVMGDDAQATKDALDTHLANKPGEYQSQWQSQLDQLMNSIMNREKFSYDLNSDALYQQYKDKYIQQGKLAMSDAIGQASAMTGGYGNSYAQAVGQQQYQQSLDNLNDIVPELYAMALDQYNREGQDLYNQYGMVSDRENLDYGRYRDTVSDYYTDLDYLTGRADSERAFDYGLYQDGYQRLLDSYGIASDDYYKGADMFYTEQNNKNSVAGQEFTDAMAKWTAETDQKWKQAEWDEAARQYAIGQKKTSVGSNPTGDPKDPQNPTKEPETSGFSGSNFNDAKEYCKNNGVSASGIASILRQTEWLRKRIAYKLTGQGGSEVADYDSYGEYLEAITAYLVETKG